MIKLKDLLEVIDLGSKLLIRDYICENRLFYGSLHDLLFADYKQYRTWFVKNIEATTIDGVDNGLFIEIIEEIEND